MRLEAWGEGSKALALTLDGQAVTEDAASLTLTEDINGDSGAVKLGSTAASRLLLELRKPRHTYAGKRLAA